jgi:proline racemase
MSSTADPLAAIRWRSARPVLTVVGCHAGGEIGNVVVAGVETPRGASIFEQMQAISADDSIRRLLLHEPRGSVAVHSNIVLPATREDCAFGYVIMEPTEYPAMSGSNTICVATVLIETGMVEMHEPLTRVRLEAPGGAIDITAGCRDGKVEWVELENVACFADRLDAPLEVEGLGTITIDVAFGGMWYAIADARALGFALEPSEARDLSRVGELIRAAAREQLPCVHPENPDVADDPCLGHRIDVRGRDRAGGGGRGSAGRHPGDQGHGLDHGRDLRPRRPDRPLSGGLSAVRHVARG